MPGDICKIFYITFMIYIHTHTHIIRFSLSLVKVDRLPILFSIASSHDMHEIVLTAIKYNLKLILLGIILKVILSVIFHW